MSSERFQRFFGLTGMPFSPDARYITAPASVPKSMSKFFEVLHGTVAYQHPMVFLTEARIGAGKTTIFTNIIDAINENRVSQFVKKNSLDVEPVTLEDFDRNRGLSFRVEMSAEIALHPEEYVKKLYTSIDKTLDAVDRKLARSLFKKREKKWQDLEPLLHDSESRLLFPLVETVYLLLDKKEGAGFDYLCLVLDEFDTILTEDPRKIDAFLDFIIRKFVEKLKEERPHWATANPKVCMVLLCTRFRSDQVKTLIERIGSGAVPRTFISGPRLGYIREEFYDVVKTRLAEFRPKEWSGDAFFPFTQGLIDKVYDAFYDKAAGCLTNMGLAEQTLFGILSKWDVDKKKTQKTALQLIEDIRREHVRAETATDLAIETKVSQIVKSEEADERVAYILDGFLEALRRHEVKPDVGTNWIIKPIEEKNYVWFCKPYDIEYQAKHRKIYIQITEFLRTPTDDDVEDLLKDLTKRFKDRRKELPAPQGIVAFYVSSANKDSIFQEKFQEECQPFFNTIYPIQVDRPTLRSLVRARVANLMKNESVETVAHQELIHIIYDVQRDFLQNINDLVLAPYARRLPNECRQVYIGMLLASYLEDANDEETICKYCNKLFKETLMERKHSYKTVGKIASALISNGFAEEVAEREWKPVTPFTMRYFFELFPETQGDEETIMRVLGERWTMIQFLLEPEAYGLLDAKGGIVELIKKSELSVDFRNLNGRVQKIAKDILETGKTKLPLMEFATQIKSLALRVENKLHSLLLMRYACDIIQKTIVARVDNLSKLYKDLENKKVPADILKSLETNIKHTEKVILTSPPEVASTIYDVTLRRLAGLLKVQEPKEEERPPKKVEVPTEEEVIKEEVPEEIEKEAAEEVVVEEEAIVGLIAKKARTLSELSNGLKISKEVVFDKVEPLIRNDQILLKAKEKVKK